MLKKTITYEDFDGNSVTEDFYFNLTKAEVVELQYSVNGGIDKYVKKIADEQDMPKLIALLKQIITLSYGKKSEDGKRFIKSSELTEEFLQSDAYSTLFMELATDTDKGTEFLTGVLPKALTKDINLKDAAKLTMNK